VLRAQSSESLDARVHELDAHVVAPVDEDLPLDAERPEGERHREVPAGAELVEHGFSERASRPVLGVGTHVAASSTEPPPETLLGPRQ